MLQKSRVGLAQTGDRKENVRQSLELVKENLIPKLADQVLLKPNFLSSTNQLASTHPDAIRGVIDFLLSTDTPPKEILIAEGANEAFSGEAYDNFGYTKLLEEYDVPIHLIDLHQENSWQKEVIYLADWQTYQVRMPKIVLDCPCTISVAVAKTHDVDVVTLALKNMIMGTLHKDDRVKMHGYPTHGERKRPREAQILNMNLTRIAHHLSPHIGVVDGTIGLQGDGPGGTDTVDLDIAVSGADVFATDAVVTKAMGFNPWDIGLFQYATDIGLGIADLERIEVVGKPIDDVAIPFKPHQWIEQQYQWQDPEALHHIRL
ncbi:hypothetical protein CMK15_06610 [Candidatus Poribacteria bacterium]|nr:hypothetical protein [Candidatus Poribacteria bacterium]